MPKSKKKSKPTQTKKQNHHHIFRGVIDINKSGVGFVTVNKFSQDILIPNQYLKSALQGDEVEVSLLSTNNLYTNKRLRGMITKIIKRKQHTFIGKVVFNNKFYVFKPLYQQSLIFKIQNQTLAQNYIDKIITAKMIENQQQLSVEIIENYNQSIFEQDEFIFSQLLSYNVRIHFDEKITNQLKIIEKNDTHYNNTQRKNYKDILTFTIDPADAKDFDDAISIQYLEHNQVEIGVHIADVTHYVKYLDDIDQEAYKRATSIYMPNGVIPMLPEILSNHICSLKPNEDRLTFSVIFTIDIKTKKILTSSICQTIIHSKHRFTYEEVQTIIETKIGIYQEEILFLNQLAQYFRLQRLNQNAINFSSTELKFILDNDNNPIGTQLKTSKESHQLIEELMLLANKTVATYIADYENEHKIKIPFCYRIHDIPDNDKVADFNAFLQTIHPNLKIKNAPQSFNQLLHKIDNQPFQSLIEKMMIRTMAKAEYATNNIGHYGLAFENYAHFTSPIRRYADVLVHRVLKAILYQTEKLLDNKTMTMATQHCSKQEKTATEIERNINKYFQLKLVKKDIGTIVSGVVSGISSSGVWVTLINNNCEGKIDMDILNHQFDFIYHKETFSLMNKNKIQIKLGTEIIVKIIDIDIIHNEINLTPIFDK